MDKSKIDQEMIERVGRKFAKALLDKDNDTLNSIVDSKSGMSGTTASNMTQFRTVNTKKYLGAVPVSENHALLSFGSSPDKLDCIISCRIENDKVGDWKVFK